MLALKRMGDLAKVATYQELRIQLQMRLELAYQRLSQLDALLAFA